MIELDEQQPARSLVSVLCDERTKLDRFASLEPPIQFVRNQVAMQLRKRRASGHAHV
jgi:hypothetical protein